MDPSDTDYASSGYDTGSTSLSSTVNEYVFENGIYFSADLNLPNGIVDCKLRRAPVSCVLWNRQELDAD
jgi:hypothetical protein